MTNKVMILMRALQLLEFPNNWCKDNNAETYDGVPTDPKSSLAARWSARGALIRAWYDCNASIIDFDELYSALSAEAMAISTAKSLLTFNNLESTTHDQVLSVFRNAKAEYEKLIAA